MTNQTAPLTPDQAQALRDYAQRHGRTWKRQLNHAWMTGQFWPGDAAPLLQQIRNSHGPAWLSRQGRAAVQGGAA